MQDGPPNGEGRTPSVKRNGLGGTCNSSMEEVKAGGCSKFEVSLVYYVVSSKFVVSSKPVMVAKSDFPETKEGW